MFTLSRIYGTLTLQRAVRGKTIHDFKDASYSDSSDDTDTDDDDGAESEALAHSPRSSKHFNGSSRHDSSISFDEVSRPQGGSLTKLSPSKSTSISRTTPAEAPEPFPDIDPMVLAVGIHSFDDPPNLQGLEINNDVEIYLERLRDDPVFGTREACAGHVALSAGVDTDDALLHVLDTSVDFTSARVSRSSSSTMSLKNHERKQPSQSRPKQESMVLEDASPSHVGDSDNIPNSTALEDPFGPRYQLPDEKMEDYVKRVSTRIQATFAKHSGDGGIDTPVSSSASNKSRNEDFDTSEELSFNDTNTCPSSPPTPFTPQTPLSHRNLSKLETPPTTTETDKDKPQPAANTQLEWSPPPITGAPIFNLTKTRLTPPRSEVYKHIDFTPLALFHRRSPIQRYIILEQDCLQCSLKNLPCDDYHPSCKRCQRSGDAPYCLRQRRLASWELKQLGLERVGGYTVLIRLPEDGDEIWEEKLRREEVLLEVLRERVEKGNWVFPADDGVRGVFDGGVVRGREVCEGRGGIWRYRVVDDLLRY